MAKWRRGKLGRGGGPDGERATTPVGKKEGSLCYLSLSHSFIAAALAPAREPIFRTLTSPSATRLSLQLRRRSVCSLAVPSRQPYLFLHPLAFHFVLLFTEQIVLSLRTDSPSTLESSDCLSSKHHTLESVAASSPASDLRGHVTEIADFNFIGRYHVIQ